MAKAPSMFEAIQQFLSPIMAEACRIVDEGNPESDCMVSFLGFNVKMKLRDIQALDRAYAAEFHRREKRDENKANGDDLVSRMRSACAKRSSQ
jgi:hypothetical protein